MAGVKGIGTGFKIDSNLAVLTDVSTYLRNIQGGSDVARLDQTTFQPDVAAPIKTETSGFRTFNLTITALYTPAAFTFFTLIEGIEGLNYQLGPQGFTVGDQKIFGLCNCLSVSTPNCAVDGIDEFTVELNLTSRSIGT